MIYDVHQTSGGNTGLPELLHALAYAIVQVIPYTPQRHLGSGPGSSGLLAMSLFLLLRAPQVALHTYGTCSVRTH